MHSLVHFADAAALLEFENGYFNKDIPISDKTFRKDNEPGTLRLIRTASKAYGYPGRLDWIYIVLLS